MGTLHVDSLVDIVDYVVLWRSRRTSFFSDSERKSKQTLSLHMVNAWKHCQLLELERMPAGLSTRREMVRRARALVDDNGAIYTADADFGPIVQEIFPAWRGSDLPYEFAALVASGHSRGLVAGVECYVARSGAFNVLTVVGLPKSMPLGTAEFDVARLFCSGLTNGEIAARRGVSATTVRNQLASVYRKLEVHSKVDLVRLIG